MFVAPGTDDMGGEADQWLTVAEASRELGVVGRTVYGLINAGALRGYHIGRVIRVRREDLESYLDSVRITPGDLDHLCGPATSEARQA